MRGLVLRGENFIPNPNHARALFVIRSVVGYGGVRVPMWQSFLED